MLQHFKNHLATSILSRPHLSDILDLWAISVINQMEEKAREFYYLKRLISLIAHAYKNVPYWGELFNVLGVDPRAIKALTNFAHIPILSKEVFRERCDEFLVKGWEEKKHFTVTTSGSTGLPLTIKFDENSGRRRTLAHYYILRVWNLLDISEYGHFFMLSDRPHLTQLGVPINFENFKESPLEFYNFIMERNIRSLGGQLNKLFLIAEDLEKRRISLNLKFIHISGEQITDSIRQYLQEVFQCSVYDRYACAEFGSLAFECGAQNGYHIIPSNNFLEIVDEVGLPITDNRTGRILVTTLNNKINPLIRYQIGDYGRWLKSPCSCGIAAPKIMIEGRNLDFLLLSDGRKFPVSTLVRIFDMHYQKYIKQFQIVQESIDHIILRVIPTAIYDSSRDQLFISGMLGILNCSKPIRISIEKVSSIPRLPSGKTQTFISKLENV